MTLREIANVLLRYVGVTNLDPNANLNELLQRGINERDIADVTNCIQGALQEIFTLAPADEIQRQVGDVLRPPANVTVSATQYSTGCTITGFASWMLGCTIRIAGDDLDNRIISSTSLLRPYIGATSASLASTVYCDCLTVDPAYCVVIEPIEFPNRARLVVTKDRESFRYWNGSHVSRGREYREHASSYSLKNKDVGEPCVAMAEREALGTAAPALYLRVNPMPGQAYTLTYTARLAPPVITQADIWTEGSPTDDPGVLTYLPNAEAVLLPFALQRWTAHPSFSAAGAQLQEIARQYQEAKTLLRKREPMIARSRAIYTN